MAESKHQYSIDELKHRENLIQSRLEDEQAQQEELEKHKVLCWAEPANPLSLPWFQGAGHRLWGQFDESLWGLGPQILS